MTYLQLILKTFVTFSQRTPVLDGIHNVLVSVEILADVAVNHLVVFVMVVLFQVSLGGVGQLLLFEFFLLATRVLDFFLETFGFRVLGFDLFNNTARY